MLAGSAAVKPEAVVTLRDSVELAGSEISLAAVARVDTEDGDLAAILAAVNLGASPVPGRVLDLGRGRILEVLRREGLDGRVELEGPDLVRVSRKTRKVTGGEIAAAAKKAVESSFGAGKDVQVECEVRSLPQDVDAPGGKLGLEAVPPAPGPGGLVLVPVRVTSDGREAATRSVSLRVRLYRDTVVARRDLPRGWKIGPEDLGVDRMEVTGAKEGYRKAEDALGKEVKIPMRAGEAVLPSRVAAPWVIQRGDIVDLSYGRGSIQVAAKGKALQGGGVGDEIEVENSRSGRKLKGRVAGPGKVTVAGSAD